VGSPTKMWIDLAESPYGVQWSPVESIWNTGGTAMPSN
jgi:hypothetical protein